MKLNLKQPLKNLAGENIKNEGQEDVTLGRVMANAIISNQGAKDPTRNYLLATDLYQKDEMDLTADDLVYLREQINETGKGGNPFPPLYKGQILNILNQLDKPEQKENKE